MDGHDLRHEAVGEREVRRARGCGSDAQLGGGVLEVVGPHEQSAQAGPKQQLRRAVVGLIEQLLKRGPRLLEIARERHTRSAHHLRAGSLEAPGRHVNGPIRPVGGVGYPLLAEQELRQVARSLGCAVLGAIGVQVRPIPRLDEQLLRLLVVATQHGHSPEDQAPLAARRHGHDLRQVLAGVSDFPQFE